MALNYVTLNGKIPSPAQGQPIAGTLFFAPSGWLPAPVDSELFPPAPVPVTLPANGVFSVQLLANDNADLPANWVWTVTIQIQGIIQPRIFSFNLFFANGPTQDISQLVPVVPQPPLIASMPLPAGTPQPGNVPVATGTGEGSVWASPGAASIPLTTFGDTLYENATPTPTRLPGNTTATRKFLRQQGNGTISAAPAWDTLVAGDIPALPYDAAGTSAAETTRATAAEALLAPLASPALTGTPTAPTKAALANNTDLATTAYADAAVGVETARAQTAEALALPKAGGTMAGWLAPAVSALTFGVSIPVNAALGNVFPVTLTANTGTIANPTNPVDGQIIRFRIAQDATGGRTVAWGAAYDFGAGGAPTLSTAASKVDVLAFEYNAALTKWMSLGAAFPQGF